MESYLITTENLRRTEDEPVTHGEAAVAQTRQARASSTSQVHGPAVCGLKGEVHPLWTRRVLWGPSESAAGL